LHYLCIVKTTVRTLILSLVILLTCCTRPSRTTHSTSNVQRSTFNPQRSNLLPITPIKDQGASDFCWIYAIVATLETEHLAQGDSVELSSDYLCRMFLEEQSSQKRISLRGTMPMALRLLEQYGAISHQAYHLRRPVNWRVLSRKVSRARNHPQRIGQLIDDALGFLPRFSFIYGCEYTTHQLMRSMLEPDEYDCLTSFTHHPFGQRFALEVPDNREADTFLNVPIDRLMAVVDTALARRHPVCWEGDTSEPGFHWSQGRADVQSSERPVSQQSRQQAFERRRTTDDHCMVIIGQTTDPTTRQRYYVCKNSWGKTAPFGGLMLLSEDYVRLKTIAICTQSEVISQVLGRKNALR